MLTIANKEVSNMKNVHMQMPCFKSSLRKFLKFQHGEGKIVESHNYDTVDQPTRFKKLKYVKKYLLKKTDTLFKLFNFSSKSSQELKKYFETQNFITSNIKEHKITNLSQINFLLNGKFKLTTTILYRQAVYVKNFNLFFRNYQST